MKLNVGCCLPSAQKAENKTECILRTNRRHCQIYSCIRFLGEQQSDSCKLSGLNQQTLLTWESRSPGSVCHPGYTPSKRSGGESFLASLTSGDSRQSLAPSCRAPVSASAFTRPLPLLCVCSSSLSYKDTCHWIQGPHK